MKKKFKLNYKSLDQLFGFITSFANKYGLDSHLHFQLELVVEELFTNMVKYDRKIQTTAELEISKVQDDLIIILTGFDVAPFNPANIDKYDPSLPLNDRPIGKLGLHLVEQIVDRIDYRYDDNIRILKLIKHTGN